VKIIRDIRQYDLGPSVAAIGNFDGIHQGHQALISKVLAKAKTHALTPILITFEPMPAEYFQASQPPVRLMSIGEKWIFLQHSGVQAMVVLKFSSTLAAMPAEGFVEKMLLSALQVKHLIVGEDFRFGYQRQGDVALLQQHMTVERLEAVYHERQRVSSTLVRQAVQSGNFDQASTFLNRDYSIIGRVIHGKKLGRTLGYPTLNIPLKRKQSPVHGIYVVSVIGLEKQPLPGVASVGTRPVVSGKELLLEVHLFDFNQDCYGQRVQVQFYQKLREELSFDNLDQLCEQMHQDSQQARAYFAMRTI